MASLIGKHTAVDGKERNKADAGEVWPARVANAAHVDHGIPQLGEHDRAAHAGAAGNFADEDDEIHHHNKRNYVDDQLEVAHPSFAECLGKHDAFESPKFDHERPKHESRAGCQPVAREDAAHFPETVVGATKLEEKAGLADESANAHDQQPSSLTAHHHRMAPIDEEENTHQQCDEDPSNCNDNREGHSLCLNVVARNVVVFNFRTVADRVL
mmetsp:Transcript_12796/g.32715  ORF Transcript_12796/g.32715 Transcript_12796/m.32715 type:complete len:213 (-) Transcript_12796:226-864(-)|eukprot:CAMPEP_0202048786 /NCGR_PEP_ID=MMETSP0963-20130614/2954_1 /ASSEMBLY_ACC=CAM_ASM_000494 /TAXON_ID=4773 /ORGANISM="Schizochytrium aggregatum, Strain ATCC28209" /LENGTH=212 /DNA_ID=CAMNT_0048613729 /DNA_START=363 /DNA_END=1001 /DNA_ORIENTATION=-